MDRRAGQFDEAFARLHPLFEGARGETVLIRIAAREALAAEPERRQTAG